MRFSQKLLAHSLFASCRLLAKIETGNKHLANSVFLLIIQPLFAVLGALLMEVNGH